MILPRMVESTRETRREEVKADALAQEARAKARGQGQEARRAQAAQARHRRRREVRLGRQMAPWWERDPEALAREIQELTDAGFRVHRDMAYGARLALNIEKGSETYRVVYHHGRSNSGARLLASKPWPDPEFFATTDEPALSAVNSLAIGAGSRTTSKDAGCVHVANRFFHRIDGAGGVLRLGAPRVASGSFALRSISGSSAALSQDEESLKGAFPDLVTGLWARGPVSTHAQFSAESVVRRVENIISDAHGLKAEDLRDSRPMLAVIETGRDDSTKWVFVRRSPSGAPIVLRAQSRWSTGQRARAPYAALLAGLKVTVIGCGAVGWTVALQLARSGVKSFVLYDGDLVWEDNLPRLHAYMGSEDRGKVDVLGEQLRAIAPDVSVDARPMTIGRQIGAPGLVADAPDLIINATGEELSTDETNAASLVLGRPAIYAWVSNGVYAGRILRVRPDETACYDCVREAMPEAIPTSGRVTGGEDPWEGCVFDTDLFASAVARAAVLTLVDEPVSDENPDHFVLEFDGPVPRARQVRIPRDPSCWWCA